MTPSQEEILPQVVIQRKKVDAPESGMEFTDDDKAYIFQNRYAGQIGSMFGKSGQEKFKRYGILKLFS